MPNVSKEFSSVEQALEHVAELEGREPVRESRPATQICYLVGSATEPILTVKPFAFIVHVCNDIGAWGKGFTRALDLLSPHPQRSYKNAVRDTKPHSLGAMSLCKVTPELFVANMIAQRGLPTRANRVVIDYDALEKCLTSLAKIALDWDASCHMPRIGCGLSGGDWHTVEAILGRTLCASGVPVCVYDLPRSDRDN